MGVSSFHASCFDNYWDALSRLVTGPTAAEIKENKSLEERVKDTELQVASQCFSATSDPMPDPIHFFGNVSVRNGPRVERVQIQLDNPVSKAGNYVRLEAMRDVVVVMSVCPQDVPVSNGDTGNPGDTENPSEVHYEVLPRKGTKQDAATHDESQPGWDPGEGSNSKQAGSQAHGDPDEGSNSKQAESQAHDPAEGNSSEQAE